MEDEMDIFGILAMVGGLALFLYGMQVLGDGLKERRADVWKKFWNR